MRLHIQPEAISIGVDIEQIRRFREKPFTKHERFYRKIFTPGEIDYCLTKRNPFPHFTARFCAKEALAKALPPEKRPGWREVEILPDAAGKPAFSFTVSDAGLQAYLDRCTIRLSLSHDREHAVAAVAAVLPHHIDPPDPNGGHLSGHATI